MILIATSTGERYRLLPKTKGMPERLQYIDDGKGNVLKPTEPFTITEKFNRFDQFKLWQ